MVGATVRRGSVTGGSPGAAPPVAELAAFSAAATPSCTGAGVCAGRSRATASRSCVGSAAWTAGRIEMAANMAQTMTWLRMTSLSARVGRGLYDPIGGLVQETRRPAATLGPGPREHPLDEGGVVLGDHAALLLERHGHLVAVHGPDVVGQGEGAHLLEVRQGLVRLVHDALVERLDARLVQEVAPDAVRHGLAGGVGLHHDLAAVEGDALLGGPRHQGVEVGLDEAGGELAVRGHEERLAHEGAELELLLHHDGRDLLARVEDLQLLLAVHDGEVAVLVEAADVARLEPAVGRERLRGLL